MLLSEIGDKEIIDLVKGSMHGKLWDAEMFFDEDSGTIKSLILPNLSGINNKFKDIDEDLLNKLYNLVL